MMFVRALLYLGSLRWSGSGGHHAALRLWPFRAPRAFSPTLTPTAPPATALPAAQPWVSAAAAQRQFHAARPWVLAGALQQQGGQPSPGMDPAAAAYLEQHGISAAQLQQEQPDAAAALTLPLARLLVTAVTARQGLKNTLAAPELAARLVFLAGEAGVPQAALQRLYVNQLQYLRFKLGSTRKVLDWLHNNIGDVPLQQVAASYPTIWGRSRRTLEAAKADLQQMLGLSHEEWAKAVRSYPNLLTSFKRAKAEGVVGWLRSDVGMSASDVSRLFKKQPSFFTSTASRLSKLLDYLLRRLHIEKDQAARLVLQSYQALGLSQAMLESRVVAMERYGFAANQVGMVSLEAPLFLSFDFIDQISPVLSKLEHLLSGHVPDMPAEELRAAVISVVLRGGGLITNAPDTLQANYEFLHDRGLSPEQARAVLWRRPQLFKLDMSGVDFVDRLRYYESELGIPEAEMLAEQGGYLKEGLPKVDQRVFCMERRGQLQRLTLSGEASSLSWMSLGLDRFLQRFGVGEEEWEAAAADWASSERVQRYRLVGQTRRTSFNMDKSKSSAAVRAAHARRRRNPR